MASGHPIGPAVRRKRRFIVEDEPGDGLGLPVRFHELEIERQMHAVALAAVIGHQPGEREEDFPDQHPLVAAIIAVGDTPHLADDLVRFRLIGGMKLQHLELLRSEEHKSELQSLMRKSYAAFCLTKKIQHINNSPISTVDNDSIRHK